MSSTPYIPNLPLISAHNIILITAAAAATLPERADIFFSAAEYTLRMRWSGQTRLTRVPFFSSTVRQIQRAPSIRTNVWSAVVRPPGGLWEWEEPRAFHTQHSARLFLLLQVSILCLTEREEFYFVITLLCWRFFLSFLFTTLEHFREDSNQQPYIKQLWFPTSITYLQCSVYKTHIEPTLCFIVDGGI